MKKLIGLIGIIGLLGFQASAETKAISNNNSFEGIINNGVPSQWKINEGFKENNGMGTLQIISESAQDGKNCLMIKNEAKQIFHLHGVPVETLPGDVIKMSVYVKGKGSFTLGAYTYSGKVAVGHIYPNSVNVESTNWEKKDFEMTVPDDEGVKGKVTNFRPVIAVDSDSEIYIDNFSGQIENAATPAATEETGKK
ncbi:MAG: hypothetical protein NT118_09500 [Lentisphaerae bacterium]|nr:hypothetical protein [Lentisphaerota bacterium]